MKCCLAAMGMVCILKSPKNLLPESLSSFAIEYLPKFLWKLIHNIYDSFSGRMLKFQGKGV